MTYDVLVVGFPKCGTTTLHNLLKQNTQIYLPECKETFFASKTSLYREGGEYLKENFYKGALPEQKIGGVEPSFARYFRRVQPYLGESTKIVFLVRNPIEYLFSFYKMGMSFGNRVWYEAFKTYGSFSAIVKIYVGGGRNIIKGDSEIISAIEGGKYIKYIQNYAKVVNSRNIKIILFEEFIKDEIGTVNALYEFIGVQRRRINTRVGENKSETIMPKNNMGRFLLEKREYLHHTYIEHRKDISKIGMFFCQLYYENIPTIAACRIDEQIDSEAQMLLNDYYDESVKELEKLTGFDLVKVWGWN